MGAFGDKLKREREMRRITLDEISESTKIPRRYLESLERENFESLPGGVFNKGFVKAYARFLGLDEEQAVADYVAVAKEESAPEDQFPLEIHEKPDRELNPRKSQLPLIAAVVALVGVLGGYAAWRSKLRQTENSEITVASASQSEGAKTGALTPEKSADTTANEANTTGAKSRQIAKARALDFKQTPIAATPVKQVARVEAPATIVDGSTPDPARTRSAQIKKNFFVVIKAKEDAWISVVADGRRVSHGTLRANKQRFVRADKEIIITTGNAGGLEMSFNGKPLGAIGSESEARTLMFTPAGQVQE
jgi:cytoskeleton protein RodZ